MEQYKNQHARNLEYYDMTVIMDKHYADSQKGKKFNRLMKIITSEANICLAFRNIKNNGGSYTPGVDGITIEQVKRIPEKKVVETVRQRLKYYQPQAVLRKEIPKANGKSRPLGIPTLWDRLIQQCILQVLQPICEAKFHERSNGFRPNRSAENAIAQCYRMAQKQGLHYVVDIDIKGFFDNVNHTKLIRQMWAIGIQDKTLICVVKAMLKAKILMPDGTFVENPKGTPQGGILSPLLSNIVLNELDWWIASQWEVMPTKREYKLNECSNGTISRSHIYQALRKTNLKEMYIVRYADDFKIFCRNLEDARKIYIATEKWLFERLGLETSPEKSGIINLKRRYTEFLGIKMKVTQKGGKWVVKSHMTDKALTKCKSEIDKAISKIKRSYNTKSEYANICQYNAIVMGMHNYYRVATHISRDMGRIAWDVNRKFVSRLGKKNLKRNGELKKGAIKEKYGKSKQLRFYHGYPLVPIKYITTKVPRYKPTKINLYTPEGRKAIHKNLSYDVQVLYELMHIRGFKEENSIEYVDNRLSLYAAQRGRCAITGRILGYDDIKCHHIIPKSMGGTDAYSNLIILDKKVHQLVHATKAGTIAKLLKECDLTDEMLQKLNKLRESAGNTGI